MDVRKKNGAYRVVDNHDFCCNTILKTKLFTTFVSTTNLSSEKRGTNIVRNNFDACNLDWYIVKLFFNVTKLNFI